MRTLKFSKGNKLNSCLTVTLLCAIEVNIITDVVDSDIPLLLDYAMKTAMACLIFENDSVTMLGRKVPMKCTSSGHYHIPITRLLPDWDMFDEISFIKKITTKNRSEKVKIATKVHR